jgi:methionyl-tRNA formyltransferase
MTILVLSQFSDIIRNELHCALNDVVFVDNFKDFDLHGFYARTAFELLICFGYNRILPVTDPIFAKVRFINLHTSLLPYGRGLNPNLTNWLNNEPHGITIHDMDGSYDTGRILFQKPLSFDPEQETLRSTYYKKILAATQLLAEHWQDIVSGHYRLKPQASGYGSLMTASMLRSYAEVLKTYNDKPLPAFLDAVARGLIHRFEPERLARS